MKHIPIAPGTRFGRLVVQEKLVERLASNKIGYLCRCDCGNVGKVTGENLKSGNSPSCGCLSRERIAKLNFKHGMKKHPFYATWVNMRSRCNDANQKSYPYYGGRGIKVDPAWDEFLQFIADMGPKPTPRHSLDRIDVDGNYTPVNCRWATQAEQVANRREVHQEERPCDECGAPFSPSSSRARYCGSACALIAHRRQERLRRAARTNQ